MPLILSAILGLFVFFFGSIASAEQIYGTKLCKSNNAFICYKVKRHDTWASLFPNENTRDLENRINRTNLPLYPGLVIAIPKNQGDVNPFDYAPLKSQIDPPGEKVIIVSIDKLAFGAYGANGDLEYWGPISSARGYCPDIGHGCHTATGSFRIYRKEGPECVSTKFPVGRGGAPMPYCMFFNGGFALHGSYEVPGYNASHGCVRLFVKDAKWLSLEFVGDENVRVIVH